MARLAVVRSRRGSRERGFGVAVRSHGDVRVDQWRREEIRIPEQYAVSGSYRCSFTRVGVDEDKGFSGRERKKRRRRRRRMC